MCRSSSVSLEGIFVLVSFVASRYFRLSDFSFSDDATVREHIFRVYLYVAIKRIGTWPRSAFVPKFLQQIENSISDKFISPLRSSFFVSGSQSRENNNNCAMSERGLVLWVSETREKTDFSGKMEFFHKNVNHEQTKSPTRINPTPLDWSGIVRLLAKKKSRKMPILLRVTSPQSGSSELIQNRKLCDETKPLAVSIFFKNSQRKGSETEVLKNHPL